MYNQLVTSDFNFSFLPLINTLIPLGIGLGKSDDAPFKKVDDWRQQAHGKKVLDFPQQYVNGARIISEQEILR